MLALIILAPILFNLTGLVDTYLTKLFGKEQTEGGLESSTGTLMIIGGAIALLVSLVIFLFFGFDVFTIGTRGILTLLFAGVFYGLAAYPYFTALKGEKIENIVPMLQTIPIFTYVIASLLLGESMSSGSIVLMFLSVCIAILFGWNFQEKKLNYKGILLIFLSAFLYSLCDVVFKFGAEGVSNVWVSYFWQHLGVVLVCFTFLFHKNTRKTTLNYFKTKGIGFSILNIGNEIFFISGMWIVNFLSLSYNVAFVNTLNNGLQPILGFVMVYVAYTLRPKIYEWDYSRKELSFKFFLCIVGFFLLFLFYRIS